MPWIYRPTWTIPGAGFSESVFTISSTGTFDAPAAAAIRGFFQALAALLPNDVSLQFPGTADLLNPVSGSLEQSESFAAPLTVLGTSSASWAGGVGAVVRWETGVIAGGRRQRGRTFLVPMANTVYDTDGTLTAGSLTTIGNAATALISTLASNATPHVVWSRVLGVETPSTTATIPDRTAILRERRDA